MFGILEIVAFNISIFQTTSDLDAPGCVPDTTATKPQWEETKTSVLVNLQTIGDKILNE